MTTPTSTSEAVASTDGRGPVTARDVDDLGAKLGDAGWGDPGVGCGESVVDLAGHPKVVCIFPDEYAEPGQSGNAVSVMTFTEWDQADAYVAEYGDETTVVEDGFIVDGPHSTAVDAAVQVITK